MKFRFLIILILASTYFLSCKKDKLKGDKSIFIGKWKWVYTDKYTNTCDPPESYYFLNPLTEGKNYSIEFLEKGKVVFFEDQNKTEKDRIVFSRFELLISGNWAGFYVFGIYRNNNGEGDGTLSGFIKQDTLVITNSGGRWPHYVDCSNCCSVRSYFIRE